MDALEKKLFAQFDDDAPGVRQNALESLREHLNIAKLKAALWVKVNWKISGGVAASLLVLVTGYWSYDRYWSRSDAVNAGLRSAVASASWGEGWGEPFAGKIGGEPYWIMLRGDLD